MQAMIKLITLSGVKMNVRCCRALKQTVKQELSTGESMIRADGRLMFELLASSKHRALVLKDDDMVGLIDQSIKLFDGMLQQGDDTFLGSLTYHLGMDNQILDAVRVRAHVCVCVCACFSLSLAHTNTRIHTRIHIHIHTFSLFPLSLAHSLSCKKF